MTYLIDGHNLIPRVPGLSLDQLDDEQELIDLLAAFSVRTGRQVEVYFDQGRIDSQRDFQRNRVHVHFVRKPMIADGAIISRLLGIGKAARNYSVVSGDHEVQNRARHLGAALLSPEDFARMLMEKPAKENRPRIDTGSEEKDDDIDEWLHLFSSGK